MTVVIYAKKDCQLCKDAKEKLDLMKVTYEVKSIEQLTEPHEGWRDDGTVEARAMLALIAERVPMIVIDGKPYAYAAAMSELKRRKNATAA